MELTINPKIIESSWQEPPEFEYLDFDRSKCFHNLGVAIMMQAVKDAVSDEEEIKSEARSWLIKYGETWAAGLGLDIDRLQITKFLGNKQKERIIKKKFQEN